MIGPFWRYYGGKWRAAPRYPAPSYGTIVEPFAGAAGYACRYADRDVILIDRDPVICSIWQWLIQATPEEVLSVPDVPDGGTTDDIEGIPEGARSLVGFWCNEGASSPRKSPSKWSKLDGACTSGAWGGWTPRARERVSRWVPRINHWTIIEGTYRDAPDIEATWFVDPPYQTGAGRHYRYSEIDYSDLGSFVRSRKGQIIACDQSGSDWLPWTGFLSTKSIRGASSEVVYHRDPMSLWGSR